MGSSGSSGSSNFKMVAPAATIILRSKGRMCLVTNGVYEEPCCLPGAFDVTTNTIRAVLKILHVLARRKFATVGLLLQRQTIKEGRPIHLLCGTSFNLLHAPLEIRFFKIRST